MVAYSDQTSVPSEKHTTKGCDCREEVGSAICDDIAPYGVEVEFRHIC
jgi:hypothetical protein